MRILFIALTTILLFSCSSSKLIEKDSPFWNNIESVEENVPNLNYRARFDPYYPDSTMTYKTPNRLIKVQVIFMNSLDRKYNFAGQEAIDFAHNLIELCNFGLSKNHKMALPEDNDTPVYPINYQYVFHPNPLDAIRFEYDDELFYTVKGKNQYNRDVISRYAKNLDSVINIFIMPHHPDSVGSPTYGHTGTGIALGNAIKLNGDFVGKDKEAWKYYQTLNHEVGHVLGLLHSWKNDQCEDTPAHPNCWGETDQPPCLAPVSNNLMDYNNKRNALTPCQLGVINKGFNSPNDRQRKLLVKNWCEKKSGIIYIHQDTEWNAHMDIQQDIIVQSGISLSINASIHLAKDVNIVVEDKGELILGEKANLYNDCGEEWGGILTPNAKKAKLTKSLSAEITNYKVLEE